MKKKWQILSVLAFLITFLNSSTFAHADVCHSWRVGNIHFRLTSGGPYEQNHKAYAIAKACEKLVAQHPKKDAYHAILFEFSHNYCENFGTNSYNLPVLYQIPHPDNGIVEKDEDQSIGKTLRINRQAYKRRVLYLYIEQAYYSMEAVLKLLDFALYNKKLLIERQEWSIDDSYRNQGLTIKTPAQLIDSVLKMKCNKGVESILQKEWPVITDYSNRSKKYSYTIVGDTFIFSNHKFKTDSIRSVIPFNSGCLIFHSLHSFSCIINGDSIIKRYTLQDTTIFDCSTINFDNEFKLYGEYSIENEVIILYYETFREKEMKNWIKQPISVLENNHYTKVAFLVKEGKFIYDFDKKERSVLDDLFKNNTTLD